MSPVSSSRHRSRSTVLSNRIEGAMYLIDTISDGCSAWGSWSENCAAGGGGEAEDDVDVVEVIAVGQVPV